ncbi:BatD family protein [Phocaeicola paurosaccharolyticus]|uniref:BatD family protein n=1 Tax=Phocaeicola paurosaccharolyticus TaxID=732242 RepID=UPI00046A83ED|nr:BatD family protein [Phocaeicola paurosaccharolyticus]
MRKLFFLIFITLSAFVYADNVSVVASAPDVVVSGDQFRLTYTFNNQNVRDFRAPSMKGFEVLMGPSRSQQSSTSIVNGKVSSSSTLTYTYILLADKEGTFTIPAASANVDGSNITSNSVRIKVLPPDKAGGVSGGNSRSSSSRSSSTRISKDDLFITVTANRTNVYEQEAILVTYKVYTLVNLVQLIPEAPDFNGFHNQEVPLPQQKSFSLERYNGRNYNTTVWSQYVLFPQQTGKLQIPSLTFEGIIQQRVGSDDPFEALFNGGGVQEVKKKIVTPKITINVKPLPSKPANFSGAVGKFTISASANTSQLRTNDAITIKVVISGTGNLKLIKTPEIKFPEDFETYDPKVDNKFNLTRNGLNGNKVIEYLAIPRQAGDFTIPPIEFTYFDLGSNSYKTIKTQSFPLKVEKGAGNADQIIANFTNKEDVKVLANDVRYIKTGDTTFTPKGDYFFGSVAYLLWFIIPFILFAAFVIIYRKKAIENANVAKVKTKKANKVATKRMRLAGKLLAEKKRDAFYDEVLKALWGYISDKLNIPVSQLSKDNIEEKLNDHEVSEELKNEFINTLNECEFARYAPGNPNEAMDKVYSSAINVISKMENSIKH